MHRLFSLVTAWLVALPASAMALGQIPAGKVENLHGKEVSFPAAFSGTPSLAILLFEHGQQDVANDTIALLEQAQEKQSTLTWVEFPLIGEPPIFVRFMIRDGMRDVISSARQHNVFPLFTEKDAWRSKADVGKGTEPLLAKLGHDGAILKTRPLDQFNTVKDILAY